MEEYIEQLMEKVVEKNPGEKEFHQAVREVLESIEPVIKKNPRYQKEKVLERIVEPERVIMFRVTWEDDNGEIHVNRGYRVEFNGAIGPYKGGLRFHPTVNLSILKFLGFEQIFKNALTGIPMGGAKGGSDFDPHGKSESEIRRFCESFMMELFRHIGPNTDVPAGDIGVGTREIGYLFGTYRKLVNRWEGVLTGKGINWGGSHIRPEATGYGATYYLIEMLKKFHNKRDLNGLNVAISGSGNVAQFASKKVTELGGKVVTLSDSRGTMYLPDGLNDEIWNAVYETKALRRGRLKEVADKFDLDFYENKKAWEIASKEGEVDIAFPCATQNEIELKDAKMLLDAGVTLVVEGANMPTTPDAIEHFMENDVIIGPAKAANAGGVAVSGLEMSQNAQFTYWSPEEVDKKLHSIMVNIFNTCVTYAEKFANDSKNLIAGANIGGFVKVADAMIEQGIY
ncbi:MAG: NADP-specific glutamate dehydrogenase [Thermoplasmata archaeon]|nr:MAG: NADP-specific glutamate dehydrogenase [Thermoplasmata archaeon]